MRASRCLPVWMGQRPRYLGLCGRPGEGEETKGNDNNPPARAPLICGLGRPRPGRCTLSRGSRVHPELAKQGTETRLRVSDPEAGASRPPQWESVPWTFPLTGERRSHRMRWSAKAPHVRLVQVHVQCAPPGARFARVLAKSRPS